MHGDVPVFWGGGVNAVSRMIGAPQALPFEQMFGGAMFTLSGSGIFSMDSFISIAASTAF